MTRHFSRRESLSLKTVGIVSVDDGYVPCEVTSSTSTAYWTMHRSSNDARMVTVELSTFS